MCRLSREQKLEPVKPVGTEKTLVIDGIGIGFDQS
jgi:hypothetical protein